MAIEASWISENTGKELEGLRLNCYMSNIDSSKSKINCKTDIKLYLWTSPEWSQASSVYLRIRILKQYIPADIFIYPLEEEAVSSNSIDYNPPVINREKK